RLARARLLRQRTLSLGQALAAGLRAGLLAKGVPVWLDTPMTGLHVVDGRVAGVRVTRDGASELILAARGVVLAAGGFERNDQMRQRYQRPPIGVDWTTGATGNTGDAITAGEAAGAALDLMDDAWWGPSVPLPSGPFFCLAERSLPGCILVNGAGRRFVNESAPYVDAVHAMYAGHSTAVPHIPSWLITDQRYRDSYVFAGLRGTAPLGRAGGGEAAAPAAGTPRARSFRRRRSPNWPGRPAWTRRGWPRPWPGSTSSPRPGWTRNFTAATRPTTATTATRAATPTQIWHRWKSRRSTPSRSCRATSAPRAACAPTSGPGCCAATAPRYRGSTRPATPVPP